MGTTMIPLGASCSRRGCGDVGAAGGDEDAVEGWHGGRGSERDARKHGAGQPAEPSPMG